MDEEYRAGLKKILDIIELFRPKVIVFVYTTMLDKIIRLNFNSIAKSAYGFNPQLEKYFKSKVFVFPKPGTPCTPDESIRTMTELKNLLKK